MPGWTQGMHTFTQKFRSGMGWKTAAAATFAGGCSLAQYGLAFSPTLYLYDKQKDFQKIIDELPDAHPTVADFVKETVTKKGYTTPERLMVKNDSRLLSPTIRSFPNYTNAWIHQGPHHDYVMLADVISTWVAAPFHDVLKEKIENNSMNDNEGDSYRALLQHEAGHLVHEDSRNIRKVALGLPCLTALACSTLKRNIPFSIKNYWLKRGLKIPTGLALGVGNFYGILAYSKYFEQRADDGIDNDIKTLEARKKMHISNKFFFGEPHWLLNTHPSSHSRINRLDERIKKLQQEQSSESFVAPLGSKECPGLK